MKLTEEHKHIIEELYPYAIRAALKIAKNMHKDDVISIAHDVLIDVVVYYRPGRGSKTIRHFYQHCLAHRLVKYYRQHNKYSNLLAFDYILNNAIDNRYTIDSDISEVINKLLTTLTDKEMEVIKYIYFDRLSISEVAKKMGYYYSSVSKIHVDALVKMRNGTPKNKYKYMGVCWRKNRKKWQSRIRFNNKQIYIGCFDSEEDAARAYNEKALELFGESAKLNNINI